MQVRKKLCAIYGEDALNDIERQCQNWFSKFHSGNFDLKNAPRSDRPIEADDDKIKTLMDANHRINNTRNCCKVEFIEFDCSRLLETSRIRFKAHYLGSTIGGN